MILKFQTSKSGMAVFGINTELFSRKLESVSFLNKIRKVDFTAAKS
jgi:hypothetical protein